MYLVVEVNRSIISPTTPFLWFTCCSISKGVTQTQNEHKQKLTTGSVFAGERSLNAIAGRRAYLYNRGNTLVSHTATCSGGR